jgi:hypothetical protein
MNSISTTRKSFYGKRLSKFLLLWFMLFYLMLQECKAETENIEAVVSQNIGSMLRQKIQAGSVEIPGGGQIIVVTDGPTPTPTGITVSYCNMNTNSNPKVLESRALCGGCKDDLGLCAATSDIQLFCNYASKAVDRGSAYFGARKVSNSKCPAGTFEDPIGNCYSCPKAKGDDGVWYQTIRGATAIWTWNACYYVYTRPVFPFFFSVYAYAVDHGKFCTGTEGAWFDIISGACWLVSLLFLMGTKVVYWNSKITFPKEEISRIDSLFIE